MKKNRSLNIYIFGLIELIFLIIFSLFIWVKILWSGLTYAMVIDSVLVLFVILVSLHLYFNRTKAKTYLITNMIRWVAIVSVIIIFDWDSPIAGDLDVTGLYFCLCALIASITTGLIMYKRYNQRWSQTLELWQEKGKIDLEQHLFRISVPNFVVNKNEDNRHLEKGFYVFITILGLSQLLRTFGASKIIDYILLKLAIIFLAGLFSIVLALFISWTINFCKMEKGIHVEFITEYGDEKELAKLGINGNKPTKF